MEIFAKQICTYFVTLMFFEHAGYPVPNVRSTFLEQIEGTFSESALCDSPASCLDV
jgi:hypothetical protein